jgi:hypothetical protein
MPVALMLHLAFAIALGAGAAPARAAETERLIAVAWNDSTRGIGQVGLLSSLPPWTTEAPPLAIGPSSVLRFSGGLLYAVSPADGTVAAIAVDSWSVERVYSLGAASQPADIAVATPQLAYITRGSTTLLLRLDLETGATSEVLDIGAFTHAGTELKIGFMALHEGRLFIQVSILDTNGAPVPTAYVAVVDLSSERLVDVDPVTQGVQAIVLDGTGPKHKMQIIRGTRQLFLSASGAFFDNGGIEVIDLDALQSLGMVIREEDGQVGADLGSFVMVEPDRGFLVFSTDLIQSSHLKEFTIPGGVLLPEHLTVVDYRVPTMVFEPETNTIFVPQGAFSDDGVHVFDALTARQLTTDVLPTGGQPTDLALLCDSATECGCGVGEVCQSIPALPHWGGAVGAVMIVLVAGVVLRLRWQGSR